MDSKVVSKAIFDALERRIKVYSRVDAFVSGEKLCREIASELEELFDTASQECITVPQAALESGYCAEHIRRLVRAGTIENLGRPGAPKVRRAYLPRKPSRTQGKASAYDPLADAQDLMLRREGGLNGNPQ